MNASNREKLFDWIQPRIGKYDVNFTDETLNTAMIAVQGPSALQVADELFTEGQPSDLSYYNASNGVLNGVPVSKSFENLPASSPVANAMPPPTAVNATKISTTDR